MNAPNSPPLLGRRLAASQRTRSSDLVLETIEALVAALEKSGIEVDRSVTSAVEAEVRAAWGGIRVYVAKATTAEGHSLEVRDAEIALAVRAGVSLTELSGRYRLSARRIRQILDKRMRYETVCLSDFRKSA